MKGSFRWRDLWDIVRLTLMGFARELFWPTLILVLAFVVMVKLGLFG